MSEDAEIVRRGDEAAGGAEPDVETLLRVYAPDHVLIENWGMGDQRSYRGREGFRQALEDNAELFDDFRNEVEEIVDAGDGVVVVIIRASGRGRASGTPVEMRPGALIRLRDGQIVSTEYHLTAKAALEAAGLERT